LYRVEVYFSLILLIEILFDYLIIHSAQKRHIKESDWSSDALIQPLVYRNDRGYNCLEIAITARNRPFVEYIFKFNSSQWKILMRNAQINKNKTFVSTPMRKLIRRMPDCAYNVLNECQKTSINNDDNLEYDFEFIEDHCHVLKWANNDRKESSENGKITTT
jgi:hypothetical protein